MKPKRIVMKTLQTKTHVSWFLSLTLLLLLSSSGYAQSSTEPLLNRFNGTWRGEGKAFGRTAHLDMTWERVLGNRFVRLSLRNEMQSANGQKQVFEGHAYYQPVGTPSDGKYEARWFDSRGVSFHIKAQTEGDTLVSFWGSPETEQGKSVYQVIGTDKMEVVDSVRQKDGTWREFGKFIVQRQQ